MKVRNFRTLAGLSLLATLVIPVRAQDPSQATQCAEANWPALQPTDPAYVDALELARTLRDNGFLVMCIAPSKWTGVFDGQKGASLYKTDRGSFEALFLPKPQNFDQLQVIQREESGEYVYSFAGSPTASPANRTAGPRPVFFIKHTNQLIIAYDKEAADYLRTAFAPR